LLSGVSFAQRNGGGAADRLQSAITNVDRFTESTAEKTMEREVRRKSEKKAEIRDDRVPVATDEPEGEEPSDDVLWIIE
jgi:hypothetical protein